MADYTAQIESIYLAYYGRPADVTGLAYWNTALNTANGDLASIINSFGTSAEATSLYSSSSNIAKINAIYVALFNRSADAEGLIYYAGLLDNGTKSQASIALDILNGATGDDLTLITKKLVVSADFTAAMQNDATAMIAYAGTTAATTARSMLSAVTATSDDSGVVSTTLTTIETVTTDTTTAAAQTFTLTTSTNVFTGGTGDDNFDSSLGGSAGTTNTLNALDNLDGGDGTDILSVEIRTAVTPIGIKNIETISSTFSGAVTFGLSGSTGLVNLANVSSTEAATYTGLPATAVNLSVVGVASDTTEFTYASTTGTQSVNLEVSSVTGAALAEIQIDGIETIAVTASGTSVYELAADAATTLSFAGSAAQTVTFDATTLSVSNYDGSAATGAITLTTIDQTGTAADVSVSGGSGNDTLTVSLESNDMSISGGAGDDTIVHTAVDLSDTIDGGDGSDALSTDMASANVLDAATPATYIITNVEAITITDAFDGTLALANIDESMNIVNLSFADAAAALMAGGDTITGPASALTVNLGGSLAANVTALGGALTLTDTGTATTDAVTLNNTAINLTTALNIDVFASFDVTSTGYESVTINTGAVSGGAEQTIEDLTITPDSTTAGVSLTITGTNALDIDTTVTTTSTGLLTIDASGMTAQSAGTTTFDIASTVQGTGGTASITGSSGEDIIDVGNFASTILGGAGNDNLTGGTAADSIDGGAGIDVIAGAGGNDTLVGGAGNDTITDSVGGSVSIDGGAGDDTVVTTNTLLTSGDTLVGGDGTDVLSTATAISTGTAGARISGFETLTLSATGQSQNMANFTNTTFTRINSMGAAVTITNASTNIATLGLDVPGGTSDFSRLVDTSADSLTIVAITDVIDAGDNTILTVDDEETLTFDTSDGDIVLTTLNAAAATSLIVTGDNLFTLEAAVVGATSLATIDASAVTGTEALNILASTSTTAITFTGGTTTGTTTLTTGSGADTVTAGSATAVLNASTGTGADTITGNAGADIIDGGSGIDSITGGEGIDSITGGSGSDVIILTETTAVSDEVVLSSMTGVDSITGFTTGTGGDQFDFGITALEAAGILNLQLLDANTDIAAGTTFLLQEVTADAAAAAGATMFALIGSTFESTSEVEDAIETGDFEISVDADVAALDGFLVMYADGTDTYIAIVKIIVDGGTDIDAGDLTVTNLAKIVGNPTITAGEWVSTNFDFIA